MVNQIISSLVSSDNYDKDDLLDNIATLVKIVDFKSISNIKNASIEELEKVVDKKSAFAVYEYFKYQ